MQDFIIFTILCIGLVIPVLAIGLRLIFKNSLITKIGFIWVIVEVIIVIEAYGIGKLGELKDFLWAFPIGFVLMFLSFMYLYRTLRLRLINVKDTIGKISEGDLTVEIENDSKKHNDELSEIAQSLIELQSKIFKVISLVLLFINCSEILLSIVQFKSI